MKIIHLKNDEIIIEKKEVLRYTSYKSDNVDYETDKKIEQNIIKVKNDLSLKSTYNVFDLENDLEISFAGVTFNSKNLMKNLKGCDKVIIFAATLGIKIDMEIKKLSKINISDSFIFNACATAAIENYCDQIQSYLKEIFLNEGYFLRPRFSPGYGDFSIEHQKDFASLLNTPKIIGLTLTDSLILIPTKSVTAIIGLSKNDLKCDKLGCENCNKIDCNFRR